MSDEFEDAEYTEIEEYDPSSKIRELEEENRALKQNRRSGELINIMQNPSQVVDDYALNQYQKENIKSSMIAVGTGGIHRFLGKYIGDIPAVVLGGFLSTIIAKKFFD